MPSLKQEAAELDEGFQGRGIILFSDQADGGKEQGHGVSEVPWEIRVFFKIGGKVNTPPRDSQPQSEVPPQGVGEVNQQFLTLLNLKSIIKLFSTLYLGVLKVVPRLVMVFRGNG